MNRSTPASRTLVWAQLVLFGWLPVWALYVLLASPVNPIHGNMPIGSAAMGALIAVVIAAALALLVLQLTERLPWPRPMRPGFVACHVAAAIAYSLLWLSIKGGVELLLHRGTLLGFHLFFVPNFVLGIWMYIMVAGVSYAVRATERAARAEASAARSQLAALRGQLNPHFLFNALHTVVQLIPLEPRRAAQAAEQIAGLLRTTLEEGREVITLEEECAFVERYLELERIRFGERLDVRMDIAPASQRALLPCFALQTLVENAVRHGAAPRIEPTTITIVGSVTGNQLTLAVHDTGAGAQPEQLEQSGGTGLQRLRERLAALYGTAARLELKNGARGGFSATLAIPQAPSDDAE